jgi:hypothetical protein
MFACHSRRRKQLTTAARLCRITAALAAAAASVLAWAAAAPAASARMIPADDNYGPAGTGSTVRVITAGGMPGWQITMIVAAAALVATAAAVLLDRARAGRRPASSAG